MEFMLLYPNAILRPGLAMETHRVRYPEGGKVNGHYMFVWSLFDSLTCRVVRGQTSRVCMKLHELMMHSLPKKGLCGKMRELMINRFIEWFEQGDTYHMVPLRASIFEQTKMYFIRINAKLPCSPHLVT